MKEIDCVTRIVAQVEVLVENRQIHATQELTKSGRNKKGSILA